MSSSIYGTPATNKIRELNQLLQLYETAITRQEDLLDRVVKGKYKATQITDSILYALVKGDLKILTAKKEEIQGDLNNLNKILEGTAKNYNGYETARSDTLSESES